MRLRGGAAAWWPPKARSSPHAIRLSTTSIAAALRQVEQTFRTGLNAGADGLPVPSAPIFTVLQRSGAAAASNRFLVRRSTLRRGPIGGLVVIWGRVSAKLVRTARDRGSYRTNRAAGLDCAIRRSVIDSSFSAKGGREGTLAGLLSDFGFPRVGSMGLLHAGIGERGAGAQRS